MLVIAAYARIYCARGLKRLKTSDLGAVRGFEGLVWSFGSLWPLLLRVVVLFSAVHISLLGDGGVQKIGLLGQLQVFVPQQGPASALLGFQRGFVKLELVNKLRDFRRVVGAAKDGHGRFLVVWRGPYS